MIALAGLFFHTRKMSVLFETGPNGFLNNKPQTLKLVEELGLKDHMVTSSQEAKIRYIVQNHQLYALPQKPLELVKFPLLTAKDKLAISQEFFKKGAPDSTESIYDFAKRRFSENIAELIFDPFISGVFAGDIRQLNLKAAFPKLF